MIEILTYTSLIAGGLLILLLLLSIFGGSDIDTDIGGDIDADASSGGIGFIKAGLTFISVGSWVVKLVLAIEENPVYAFGAGLIAGLIAVFILNLLLRLLLKQQSNVNWKSEDALFKEGKVYLKIPASGQGIVQVTINGTNRELKAKTQNNTDIPTGATVTILDIENNMAIVEKSTHSS